MEPNQNITTSAPVPTPTQPSVANKSEDIVFADKPKKSKAMILGMIFLALLAIGGIGFGVWAWMDGNTQKDNLNLQIADLKAQNVNLLEQINDDEENIDENGSTIDTADYIYVGEWGIKIKIPEGLNVEDYAFNTESAAGDPVTRISVGLVNGDYGEYYLGTVVRTSKSSYDESLERPYEPAFSDDKYYYIVSHPNGDIPVSLQSELELISSMLSNAENYSEI